MVIFEVEYHRKRDCCHRCEERARNCNWSDESFKSCNREFKRCISACEYTSRLSLDPNAMP